MYERLELFIESLTGTAFELRVSPFETIQDIKAKIQKLEGIPISQQHLIWQTVELKDECCLSDYGIQSGATLKLVLTMRGGPINTRPRKDWLCYLEKRAGDMEKTDGLSQDQANFGVPMDDPSMREMAEYLTEAHKDEVLEKGSNRPVTVVVYHNGDQFTFFRVVDRESTSPLSESLSAASVYNLYDEEEDEEDENIRTGSKLDENDKTREKMKLLRMKMENMTISKKKLAPRPPSTGRPSSRTRLRRLASQTGQKSAKSLNRNRCLPPVGKTLQDQYISNPEYDPQTAKELFHTATEAAASPTDKVRLTAPFGIRRLESVENTKLKTHLFSVKEDNEENVKSVRKKSSRHRNKNPDCDNVGNSPNSNSEESIKSKETILHRAQSSLRASTKYDFSPEVLVKASKPSLASKQEKAAHSKCVDDISPDVSTTKGLERLLEGTASDNLLRTAPLASNATKDDSLSSAKDHRHPSTSVRHSIERLHSGGVVLESLHPSEVRAMSGMLSSIVRSASKTRMPSPDGKLMSARLMSPTYRLPPVKQKKKSKRCYVCGKKTGLANSYPCRCSQNFCATHRYPEAHSCTFDYKTEGRKLLKQNNVVVTAPKLPKI